jgi:isoaspartyl peptidase/L-asparaginase-like protein (Ntn-hydrolase superfamily)
MNVRPAIILHGGAGPLPRRDYAREIDHMRGLIESGRDRLAGGAAAMDVVVEIVQDLEASGFYVAGRGASPNAEGVFELDASVMDGRNRRAGAVAGLVGFKSPIMAARTVMDQTRHVLLVGSGAARFCGEQGLEPIGDPDAWFTPAWRPKGAKTGTVGCVVRDASGALAAGTSTGGVFDKLPGRVGDSPIPGAGVWADERVAVSCTGVGEVFIRASVAAQIAHRMRFGGEDLASAAANALAETKVLGGEGGLIALGADGAIAKPYNTAGMKRAWLTTGGEIGAAVFGGETA